MHPSVLGNGGTRTCLWTDSLKGVVAVAGGFPLALCVCVCSRVCVWVPYGILQVCVCVCVTFVGCWRVRLVCVTKRGCFPKCGGGGG